MNCHPTSKKLCGSNECSICFNRSFATHSKAKYWSPKNKVLPIQVFKNSNKKYLFDCSDCGHEIEMIIKNVNSNQWCKYCNSDGICYEEKCEFCFNKSFASHPMSINWSSKNDTTSRMILKGSDKKVWFDCNVCNHSFNIKLFSITKDVQCKYCSNQSLCEEEKCNICFIKSCASHEMSKAWSSLNYVTSRNIFLQSNKKIIFNCLICKHQYETTPNHYYNRDGSCPYCSNKYLCDKEDCNQCFNKSFASHPLAHCWSVKNDKNPRNLFKGSETNGIFNCDICHSDFESKLYNVLTGYWCPYCKKKTEALVLKFLKEQDSSYKTQLRFDWCRYSLTNNIMPYDFGCHNKKILIEIDGEQHFNQISNWDSPEIVQNKDIEKIKYSIQNNYSIIHIYQPDIWKNKYNWKDILLKTIQQLIESENRKVIFISSCDKYNIYITQLPEEIQYEVIYPKV
jgi:DNA-directed RNA polymerase subunit RPC12/RpoP/very-short-patch-repair endonuclease